MPDPSLDISPLDVSPRLGPRNPEASAGPAPGLDVSPLSVSPVLGNPLKTPYDRVPSGGVEGSIASRAYNAVIENLKHNWETRGQPVFTDPAQPLDQGEFLHGVRRGVSDFLDTGAEALATGASKLPLVGDKVDVEGLRNANTADRKKWEEEHPGLQSHAGRLIGQIGATLPVLGGVGGLVGRGVSMVPGAVGSALELLTGATPAASTLGRAGQLAVQGAGSGGLQAGLTSSGYDDSVGSQVATGAGVGAVGGPVIGGLTKALDVLGGYSASIQPEIANLARRARDLYDVNIPIASMSSNRMFRNIADVGARLPFSGADAANLAARRGLQRVAASEMGSTADTFGPGVMSATRDRIRAGYNAALASVPSITGGAPLANDLAAIGTDATRFLDNATAARVGQAIREVGQQFQGGPFTGQAYKSFTASDGPLAAIEAASPGSAQPYLARIRTALRDRLIASAPDPNIANNLRALDAQYRAMKTLQPLAQKSTTGDIALGQVQGRVNAQSNKFDSSNTGSAYTGGGTLGDVGRIGKQFFGALDDSGTAPRMQAFKFAERPFSTAVGAVPGIAINWPLQAYLRSRGVAGRMIDTSLGGATPDIGRRIPRGLLGTIDLLRDRSNDEE